MSFRLIEMILKPIASQDAAHGSLPTLFAAVSPQAVAGGYYGPDGPGELKGYPASARVNPVANDVEFSKRLWSETERLVGTKFDV